MTIDLIRTVGLSLYDVPMTAARAATLSGDLWPTLRTPLHVEAHGAFIDHCCAEIVRSAVALAIE